MIPIDGQPILTAAQMRAAEERAIVAGSSIEQLMQRAGAGVAEAVRRLAAGSPVLVLCGPGNNGGDGYVAARVLRANGIDVHVMASDDPNGAAASTARTSWQGPIKPLTADHRAPVVVDALFGTGLSRTLDPALRAALALHVGGARLAIAVDLPSGVDTDTGAMLGAVGGYDLTLALGAVKRAHVLEPAASLARLCRLIDIGLEPGSDIVAASRPILCPPTADAQKYTRGMVAIVAGAMPGAAALAAEAALRAGAGYVLLLSDERPANLPSAIVCKPWSDDALEDPRIGTILIGPGLGRNGTAERRLDAALATDRHLVIDGDALHLMKAPRLAILQTRGMATLTPHRGEFAALFGKLQGSKIDTAIAAARQASSTVVFKGADTVIARPDGTATVSSRASSWLSTAGTGDVLAGAIAARIAATSDDTDKGWAAAEGVWLHAEAARRLGGAFIADDLARELSAVRAAL